MGEGTSQDYWTYWLQQMTVTNGAGGAGDHTYSIAGQTESVFDIIQAEITNGDTLPRNLSILVVVLTPPALPMLPASSLNAAAVARIPFLGQIFAATGKNADLTFPYNLESTARMLF